MLLRGVACGGAGVGLYGIAQYFGWDPLQDARGYHVGEGIWAIVRPPSTLGHADYSANWLLFAVFGSVALAGLEVKAWWKRFAWMAAAVAVVAIVFSGTRAAMLGLVIGGVVWLVGQRRRRGLRGRSVVPAAVVVAALAAGFYASPAGEKMRARVHWALTEPAGGARFLLWRDTLRMAASHLPVGYGPETFISTFALHVSPDLARAYPDFYHESPHNIFLDALVAQGLPGPLLLLALAASGVAAVWRVRGGAAAGALCAGLIAMTISEQFTSFTMPTALAYYVTIAMLVSLSVTTPVAAALRDRQWMRWAVAIPCAAILAFFGWRLAMAETALAATRTELHDNRLSEAADDYAEYERWRWPGTSSDLWHSRRLAQIAASNAQPIIRAQAFQQAGAAALRAVETSDAVFNAYYNLSAFYARENDFARTEQSLRSAIRYAPNWYKTHWMLAQVLQAGGRLKEAEQEASTAVSLDGGKHSEVTATRDRIRTAQATSAVEPQHK